MKLTHLKKQESFARLCETLLLHKQLVYRHFCGYGTTIQGSEQDRSSHNTTLAIAFAIKSISLSVLFFPREIRIVPFANSVGNFSAFRT